MKKNEEKFQNDYKLSLFVYVGIVNHLSPYTEI